MVHIYVLKLENDKYYVGKSNNLDKRIDIHTNNYESLWTTKYKPLSVIETISGCDENDDYDEDIITIKYMCTYGVDNVRGGSFITIDLPESTKRMIDVLKHTGNVM